MFGWLRACAVKTWLFTALRRPVFLYEAGDVFAVGFQTLLQLSLCLYSSNVLAKDP